MELFDGKKHRNKWGFSSHRLIRIEGTPSKMYLVVLFYVDNNDNDSNNDNSHHPII
jgi:hypothetical protein